MRLKIDIFMKSGNKIRVKVKKFDYIKDSGGDVTIFNWEGFSQNNFLKCINLSQIEAIVVKGVSLW
jgi:hypothetical protein